MDFHDLTFEKDIDDMDEGELRSTLSEFQTKHRENAEAADDLAAQAKEYQSRIEDLEAELDQYEELDEQLGDQFASLIAEQSELFTDEEIRARYSTAELVEKAEQRGLFELPGEESEADEDDPADEFDEQPPKAPADTGDEFRDQAKRDLETILR